MKHLLIAAIISLATAASQAAPSQPAPKAGSTVIVDTAFVQDALKRGAVVWDTRSADDYKKWHIPGAVNIGEIGKTLRHDSDEDSLLSG